MIDIFDIREELIKMMTNKYVGKQLSQQELNKFYKYYLFYYQHYF